MGCGYEIAERKLTRKMSQFGKENNVKKLRGAEEF